ncbi:MAG: esterase/lipase family protein, partial [Terriglobia bacterium]
MSSEVQHIIGTGDSLLRVADLKWAEPPDFNAGRSVILVHGFTSHGYYLRKLGNFLMTFGYRAFIFNYNSYRGIARASESLKDFLLRYDRNAEGGISANRVFIIAHSMGGLVARHVAVDPEAQRLIRGIA